MESTLIGRTLVGFAAATLALVTPASAAKGVVKGCSTQRDAHLASEARRKDITINVLRAVSLEGRDVSIAGAPLAGLESLDPAELTRGVDAALLHLDLPAGPKFTPPAPGAYLLRLRATGAEIDEALKATKAGTRPPGNNVNWDFIADDGTPVLGGRGHIQWLTSLGTPPDASEDDVFLDLSLEQGRDPVVGQNEKETVIQIWVSSDYFRICFRIVWPF